MKKEMIQIFISRIPGLSTREKILVLEQFPLLSDLIKLKSSDLEYILNRKLGNKIFNSKLILDEAEGIFISLIDSQIEIISYSSINYPPQLREIFDPPFLLYKRGGELNPEMPAVAVVGTRKPTQSALRSAFNLGIEIADYEIYLVSGLALGIDQAAHRGVVGRSGHTIAVLGNGIDFIYPKENTGLGQEIIDLGGIILSEYPPGTPPVKYNFPERNRIISGLSKSLVVIEAPYKSGALISAEFALDQGRDVYVHRCSINSRKGAGCRRLLFEGADIIESLGDFVGFREAV
jgi:DNA processing protein